MDVHYIGKIDLNIYKCITEDIVTDEVVITEKQVQHIRERHPAHYEKFSEFFLEIVADPDYIVSANKPNSALLLKNITQENKMFKTVLRLAVSKDPVNYKNSIITFMKIDEKEWERILRNKIILYRKV